MRCFLFCVLYLAGGAFGAGGSQDPTNTRGIRDRSTLIVEAVVTDRHELWDRRSNTLMGAPDRPDSGKRPSRPDRLVAITYRIEVTRIVKGSLPGQAKDKRRSIHVVDRKLLRKDIARGDEGVFFLTGSDPYVFEGFSLTKRNPPQPKIRKEDPGPLPSQRNNSTEEVTGPRLRDSPELRQKTAREIGAKYGMVDPETVIMTSYSGPEPPDGGYVHWGVRGLIDGRMHIWQNGRLREGSELEDPHRHQKCNPPDAMISTPEGPVRIDALSPGDLVLSADGAVVPILRVSRVPTPEHWFVRLTLDDGRILEISAGHPAVDGSDIGLLRVGESLDRRRIVARRMVRSAFEYTCDILPDSESGAYVVNGILVGSTLKE